MHKRRNGVNSLLPLFRWFFSAVFIFFYYYLLFCYRRHYNIGGVQLTPSLVKPFSLNNAAASYVCIPSYTIYKCNILFFRRFFSFSLQTKYDGLRNLFTSGNRMINICIFRVRTAEFKYVEVMGLKKSINLKKYSSFQ